MQNSYEIAVLYHPDLEIDLEKATSKVEGIFKDNGAVVTNTDNWGKRKLAYPIKNQEFGIYVFYTVDMNTGGVTKLEQTLNITDEVIRFMITHPDLKAKEKAEALKADKAKKAAERADRSDNEDDEEEKS